MKTVALSEETHRELLELKLKSKANSTDKLIHKLIVEHRKLKLLEASRLFRETADKKGLKIKDILREGENIRKEMYAKWFESGS